MDATEAPSLAARLAAIRNRPTQTPSETLAVLEDFIAWQRRELMPNAISAGARFPDFVATDSTGATVDTAALRRHGPLVISLFRGSWCPYCTQELVALEEG